MAKKEYQCFDEKWPGGLADCFDTIVLNEAHLIKNCETEVHGTIVWLKAHFHLCMTATPLIGEPWDFAGYLHLLQPSSAEAWWKPQQPSNWELGHTVNPYELKLTHPGQKLCLTVKAAEEFIFAEGIRGRVAGSRMRQI